MWSLLQLHGGTVITLVGLMWLTVIVLRPEKSKLGRDDGSDWKNYKSTLVANQEFLNREVLLDGYHYESCSFRGVTFVYNGVTPIQVTHCQIYKPFVIRTENKSIDATMDFLKKFKLLDVTFVQPPTV